MLTLYDYVMLGWAARRPIGVVTLLSVLLGLGWLTLRPTTHVAQATLAMTPPAFGQRVEALVTWGALPDEVQAGVRLAVVKREDALLRVVVAASEAREATEGLDRLLGWIERERRIPPPWTPPPPRQPASPPSPDDLARWRQELQAIEARLLTVPPAAASYWTSRAMGLYYRLEAADRTTDPGADLVPPPPPEPERTVVLKRPPVEAAPRTWLLTPAAAALVGLLVTYFGVLARHYWREAERMRATVPLEAVLAAERDRRRTLLAEARP